MSHFSRRQFVQGGVAAAFALRGRPGGAHLRLRPAGRARRRSPGVPETVAERLDPAVIKQLALRAIDTAIAEGVTYADVRLSRTISMVVHDAYMVDDERLGVGVRCFVNGYWGFAASGAWHSDEMVTLARNAAHQAKANAKGPPRPVEWLPMPAVTGDWETPIDIDPFSIPIEDRVTGGHFGEHYLAEHDGLMDAWFLHGGCSTGRQELALATSEGTYVTQAFYQWYPGGLWRSAADGPVPVPQPSPNGRGICDGRDVFRHWFQELHELGPQLREEYRMLNALPWKSVERGRYDVVFDGNVSCGYVFNTIGLATQLDRALGYESNSIGVSRWRTSYLGPDPLALLGSYQFGSPLLTVTANRSWPYIGPGGEGYVAPVKWDAEGVEPEEVALVKDGILVDYQTTREQAGWLAPYYQKVGKPVRSHGYAAAPSALDFPLQHTPNLMLEGGTPGTPGKEMIKSIKKGIYFTAAGYGDDAVAREIINGKLGARLRDCQILYRPEELWRHLVAVGPADEMQLGVGVSVKGQPAQGAACTIRAVPTQFRNLVVIPS